MNEKQFMVDLWDMLRGNTDYCTLEQFRAKYDEFFVELDNNIRLMDDKNEWQLGLQKVWSNN